MPNSITFQDIFKKNFLNSQEFEGITLNRILISLTFAFCIGMLIYLIYRASNNSAMFVHSFAVALVALTMITSIVIITITSNVLLSLGMVGALSIVRFRTAVKEAIDIVYMFWAISAGIAIGAGFYFIATVSAVVIGVTLFVMSKFTLNDNAFVLVVTADEKTSQQEIENIVKPNVKRSQFKAKTAVSGSAEYTYEIRLSKHNTSFTNNLSKLAGVQGVSLVAFKSQNYL